MQSLSSHQGPEHFISFIMTVPDKFPSCLDQFEVVVVELDDEFIGIQFVDQPGFFFQVYNPDVHDQYWVAEYCFFG